MSDVHMVCLLINFEDSQDTSPIENRDLSAL